MLTPDHAARLTRDEAAAHDAETRTRPARTLADIGRQMIPTGLPGVSLMAAERRARAEMQDFEDVQRRTAAILETPSRLADALATAPGHDDVNHPSHYTTGDIECIDAIEAAMTTEAFVGFCRGNALKYVWRAGLKGDAATDLRKACWYLERAAVALDDAAHGTV